MEVLSLFYQMLATATVVGGVFVAVSLRYTPNENSLKFDGVRFQLAENVVAELTREVRHEQPPLSFPNRLAA